MSSIFWLGNNNNFVFHLGHVRLIRIYVCMVLRTFNRTSMPHSINNLSVALNSLFLKITNFHFFYRYLSLIFFCSEEHYQTNIFIANIVQEKKVWKWILIAQCNEIPHFTILNHKTVCWIELLYSNLCYGPSLNVNEFLFSNYRSSSWSHD